MSSTTCSMTDEEILESSLFSKDRALGYEVMEGSGVIKCEVLVDC
jgi:hypothetical protein